MARRALDSNYLFEIWHGRMPPSGKRRKVDSVASARGAAQAWLKDSPTDGIVTPVKLEFFGARLSPDELAWADELLSQFALLDQGRVLPEDWDLAERLARRVPWTGRKRGVVDCLCIAICKRLNLEFRTHDTGTPNPHG